MQVCVYVCQYVYVFVSNWVQLCACQMHVCVYTKHFFELV